MWQNARRLVQEIYCLTKVLPAEEKFGLISQIQRAVVSVSSNIAEGSSRKSHKDQAHFYQTAYASLMEVLCQLILCQDLNYISESSYIKVRESIDMIAYQLTKLRNAAMNQPSQPSKPSTLSKPPQPSQPSNPSQPKEQ